MRAAWVLNALAIWPVLFYAPGRVYRAFVRGRHSRNLYDGPLDEALLEESVDALRARLDLKQAAPSATRSDRVAFAGLLAQVVGLQLVIAAVLFGLPLRWLLG